MISVLALRFLAPPTTAFMLRHWAIALTEGRDGSPLRYDWVDYERISRDAALAVVAAEDQLFPSHSGFDFKALSRALGHNHKGRALAGPAPSPSRWPRTSSCGRDGAICARP
jgi:monofunctional glycosyltransferase